MSRKMQWGALALILLLGIAISSFEALSDVTGEFITHISISPQTTSTEFSTIDFDIENELNVAALISGLTTTLHSHFGIAGMEDIIVRISTTIGVLDAESTFVLARFAFGSTTPFYPSLHFVKKKLIASLVMGGVKFTTTSQFEDTAAFTSQTSAYAFGNVFELSGQTLSGVNISAELGICMEQVPNRIKKHPALSPFSVNPECATTPKPDILFDFETVLVSGVPLAPNVVGSGLISCITFGPCSFTANIVVSGGIVPFSTVVTFTDLLELTMGNTTITFFQGPGTLSIILLPNGTIGSMSLTISATLNAEANSASFSISGSVSPGVGLTSATARISIQRAGLTVDTIATFGGGPPAEFQTVTFGFSTSIGIIELQSEAKFTPSGLSSASIDLNINF